MATSPDLGIPYIAAQQGQPEVTHNDALNMLAGMMKGALDFGLNIPPVSPDDGDVHILGSAPTGAWAGEAHKLAYWASTYWLFIPGLDSDGAPIAMGARQAGLSVYVRDDDATYHWTGTAWISGAIVAADIGYIAPAPSYAANVEQALDELYAGAGGGGGGGAFGEFAYDPPLAADFTIVNGGTATASLTDYPGKGLGLKVTASGGGRSAAAVQAPPAAPYTLTARVTAWEGFVPGSGELIAGIILRNSSNGRSQMAFRYPDRNIYTQTFTDMDGGGSGTVTGPQDNMFMPNSSLYFAVNVDGSGNIQFYYSGDGAQWEPFGAATTAGAFLTASGGTIDEVGIYIACGNTAGHNGYLLCPFLRIDAVNPPAMAL